MTQDMSLPVQFRTLTRITNHQCRTATVSQVSDILHYLENLKHYQMPPATGALVSRFFLYLTASCKDVALVNKRSQWLCTYSELVYRKLALYTMSLGLIVGPSFDLVANDPFYYKLIDMLSALKCYCTLHRIDPCFIPTKTLTELFSHGKVVVPNPNNVTYCRMMELITGIKAQLDIGTSLTTRFNRDTELSLFYDVKKLIYLTSKYNIPPL